jgi:hypothetical protein
VVVKWWTFAGGAKETYCCVKALGFDKSSEDLFWCIPLPNIPILSADESFLLSELAAPYGSRINYQDWLKKTSIDNQVTLVGWPDGVPMEPKKIRGPALIDSILKDVVAKKIFYRRMEPGELEKAIAQRNAPETPPSAAGGAQASSSSSALQETPA